MNIYSDEFLSVGWLSGKLSGSQVMGTFFVKAAFSLKHGEPPVPAEEPILVSGDLTGEDDEKQYLRYPSDFVPLKARADVIVVGTGYAPGGNAVPNFKVGIRVGDLKKGLDVTGKRAWEHGLLLTRPGQPHGVVKVPIVYSNAWGGKKYERNPLGRGRDTIEMHNIEIPHAWAQSPRDEIEPAGFGPVPAAWEPRKSMVGSYKDKWLKERWPWYPEDFDWGYFNAAPRDQQVGGYLRGDEEMEFQNLHPQQTVYRSKLPGLKTRCFLHDRTRNDELLFREVPLKLDTLWVDMDGQKMILVWRGLTTLRTIKLKEIVHVFAITEPLGEPDRTLEEYRVMLKRRFLPEADPVAAAQKADADAASQAAFDKKFADMENDFAKLDKEADRMIADQKPFLARLGIDPALLEPKATAPLDFEALKASLAGSLAELKGSIPEQAAQLQNLAFPEIAEAEEAMTALDEEMKAMTVPTLTRESVVAAAGGIGNVAGRDLSGLDLSGLDLSGLDLSGALLKKTNLVGTKLAGANLSQADLSDANLQEADLTGANLSEADLTGAVLAKARLTGMSIDRTIASGLDLQGADFSGCTGKGTDFSRANLTGARLKRARLPQANFSHATVNDASFEQAQLQAAQFDGAKGCRIQMPGADLTGLHGGEKADFSLGNFRSVNGADSIWEQTRLEGADFSNALLARANFNEAFLREARFDRVDAVKASFEDACLHRALLTNANLLRTTFARADLTQANLSNSNLFEAGFWDTVFGETITYGADLRRTLKA